jgi:hypothetical protein
MPRVMRTAQRIKQGKHAEGLLRKCFISIKVEEITKRDNPDVPGKRR